MRILPRRKHVAIAVRILFICIIILPLLTTLVVDSIARLLNNVTSFIVKKITNFEDKIDLLLEIIYLKIVEWESNSPEGTMERLKKTDNVNDNDIY